MIYLKLYYMFFKIGLFSVGGGLATIPLLQDAVLRYKWLSLSQFVDMIAISQSTPGPIGINMATYVGFSQGSFLGAIMSTAGIVTPSLIIIIIIAHYFMKFNEEPLVKSAFYGLRPAVTGLIAAACFDVAKIALFNIDKFINTKVIYDLFNIKAIILCGIIVFMQFKYKKHPIFYIVIAAFIGVIFKF
ncbi:MAG: chromate transporter [Clostridiaceae bacterium]